jgi:hypothetical protein
MFFFSDSTDRCSIVDSRSNDKNLSFFPARLTSSGHFCAISPAASSTEQSDWEKGNCNSSKKSERPRLVMSADDPTSYIRANRKLKKAVLEHYRLVNFFMCILQAGLTSDF